MACSRYLNNDIASNNKKLKKAAGQPPKKAQVKRHTFEDVSILLQPGEPMDCMLHRHNFSLLVFTRNLIRV